MNDSAVPTPAERAQVASELEHSRDELLAACAPLTPADWSHSDGPGRWTPAQIVEHLALTDRGILAGLEAMLAAAPDRDWKQHTARLDAIVPQVAVVSQPLQAPAPLLPSGAQPPSASLQQWREARADLLRLAARQDVAFKEHTKVDPLVGPINGYQLLRLAAFHTRRHLAQMQRCLARSDPRT